MWYCGEAVVEEYVVVWRGGGGGLRPEGVDSSLERWW